MKGDVRGRIFPSSLPWSISPSGSFLRLTVEEERDATIVEATVNRLADDVDELRPACVRLSFHHGILAATHGLGPTGHFEPETMFDASAVLAMWREVWKGEEPARARWRRLGRCEDSGVYQVVDSLWDGRPVAAPWRHFVLRGTEMWVEVLARSCQWIWVDAEGRPLGGGGEIDGLDQDGAGSSDIAPTPVSNSHAP